MAVPPDHDQQGDIEVVVLTWQLIAQVGVPPSTRPTTVDNSSTTCPPPVCAPIWLRSPHSGGAHCTPPKPPARWRARRNSGICGLDVATHVSTHSGKGVLRPSKWPWWNAVLSRAPRCCPKVASPKYDRTRFPKKATNCKRHCSVNYCSSLSNSAASFLSRASANCTTAALPTSERSPSQPPPGPPGPLAPAQPTIAFRNNLALHLVLLPTSQGPGAQEQLAA